MKITNGTYARYFNDKTGRTGHLFQERFRSEPINDERYLMAVICYIHDNPRKAGIALTEDYPWSSYSDYVRGDGHCAISFPLEVFGSSQAFVEAQRSYQALTPCLDVDLPRSRTRPMREDLALEAAREVLGDVPVNELKSLPIKQRDAYLRLLGQRGISVRQIERFTGIGRGSIQRAWSGDYDK